MVQDFIAADDKINTQWTHRTKTGRVVYMRKLHQFSAADLARIAKSLAPPNPDKINPFLVYLRKATVDMIAIIIASLHLVINPDDVYDILLDVVNAVLNGFFGLPRMSMGDIERIRRISYGNESKPDR